MTNQYRTDKPNDNEQNDDNTQKSFESGRRRKNMRDYGIKKSNYYKNNYDYDNRDYYKLIDASSLEANMDFLY